MAKKSITLDALSQMMQTQFSAILGAIDTMADTMVTKADYKKEFTGLRRELVTLVHGEFAKLRIEDIDLIKQDIAAIKEDTKKIRRTFAPRLEFDDRLRAVEEVHGIERA
jgi:hypothetical protein